MLIIIFKITNYVLFLLLTDHNIWNINCIDQETLIFMHKSFCIHYYDRISGYPQWAVNALFYIPWVRIMLYTCDRISFYLYMWPQYFIFIYILSSFLYDLGGRIFVYPGAVTALFSFLILTQLYKNLTFPDSWCSEFAKALNRFPDLSWMTTFLVPYDFFCLDDL